jgi:DNA end-binding protein Ku
VAERKQHHAPRTQASRAHASRARPASTHAAEGKDGGREESGSAEKDRPEARPFWSGTLTFGLVSVPVDLYPAVRQSRIALRMLGPDGHPLARRYYCSEEGQELQSDEIVRGYPYEDGRFIVVTDEELEAIEPRKSRDIDLRRFVERSAIDPRLLERPYVLAPSGESTKAYHLLAETMERSGRAGIATFVMRGKEYLAAIFAEGGLLRAETMRFADELRTPEDVGLPPVRRITGARRREMDAALQPLLSDELDQSRLSDEDAVRLLELAQRKRAESRDVVEVPEVVAPDAEDDEASNVVDIMSLLKQRVGALQTSQASAAPPTRAERSSSAEHAKVLRPPQPSANRAAPAELSKKELYERAKALDIPGRSNMSKEELVAAVQKSG